MLSPSTKLVDISRASDSKEAIFKAVGSLDDIEIFFNHILVGTYIRPEKTKGGIILTQNSLKEDEYQGKVGLVLKKGPLAFVGDENVDFVGQDVEVGDWIVYRVGDGWSCTVNGTHCRMIVDRNIRMRIKRPEAIF